ncbi:MAG: NAD-dependent DNA ligase LigA [Sphingobacteriales bacterium]|nr:NAD-dependent DNA ligase LigA [Sphingobacteriales bacterium]
MMYTAEQAKILQHETLNWLQESGSNFITTANLEAFRNLLRFHEYRYYVMNDPLIADEEYDRLYTLLVNFEKTHPESISKDSPTQRVGAGMIKDFPKVQHLVPMLSLENSYNADDLYDWDRKVRERSGKELPEYTVEPKFDGASISLRYENDLLQLGLTRGDGETGDDITPNIKQIRSVPLSAPFSDYGIQQIEIRGEVLMNKNNFRLYNESLMEEGLPPLANPRNASAGSLRIKDTAVVARRNLEAFLYHVSYIQTANQQSNQLPIPQTHSGILQLLWNMGFRTPVQEMKVVKGIDAVQEVIEDYEKKRDQLPYEIDGMVIKVNELPLQDQLGMTAHHPRWAIAFKFKARQASSRLLDVQFQVGRTGAITPVAKIQPVQVGGVTVSSISIHNEAYIGEKNLMIGDQILIERSGDVIPQIVKSMTEVRTGDEKAIQFPTHCPACGDILYKPENESVWRCININCPAQVLERIIHFVSKDAMDIRSFGEANVRKFHEMKLITDIPSIYQFEVNQLLGREGFGAKSVENLKQAIENSKDQPLHRLIYALGIRYVGVTTAKTLAQQVDDIFAFQHFSEEELQQMEDVGDKVSKSIYAFFHNPDNITMLEQLAGAGLQTKKPLMLPVDGNLAGQTFLFTGTLSKLKRTEAEERVERNGGKLLSGVSSKLNYLVAGLDAGSKLEKAKKIPGIIIIDEEEFLKILPG